MSKPKFPMVITEMGVTAKIRKFTQKKNGETYTLFVAEYLLLGKRKREAKANLDEAIETAKEACRKIANNEQDSLTLTSGERLTYLRAVKHLPTGTTLDEATEKYAIALKILNGKASIADACREWIKRNDVVLETKTVREVADDMLAVKRSANVSKFHLTDMTSRLKGFADSFQVPIGSVTGKMIQQWLDGLKGTARTKRNYLRIVAMLWRFGILRKYLPKDAFDEILAVQPPNEKKEEVQIFTPSEMQEILNAARPEIRPFLAIAAFSGLRSQELSRLDWSEIHTSGANKFIEVKCSKSKTGSSRLVPISDNLAAWLAPHAQVSGNVVPFATWWLQIKKAVETVNTQRTPENKFVWKRNALRHSFCSYRTALIKNIPQVSLEAGNSPKMIENHYNKPMLESVAREWFAIMPPLRVLPSVPENSTALAA